MTDALDTRRRWATYIELLQIAMGLQEWSIRIAAEDADEECDAQILPTYGARHAALRIGSDLEQQSARRVRAVIVHELLHLHHAAPDHLAEQALRQFGPYAYDGWEQAMEYAVDAIARAWAPRLPLPLDGLFDRDAEPEVVAAP